MKIVALISAAVCGFAGVHHSLNGMTGWTATAALSALFNLAIAASFAAEEIRYDR